MSHIMKSDLHKEFDPLGTKKDGNLAKSIFFYTQTVEKVTILKYHDAFNEILLNLSLNLDIVSICCVIPRSHTGYEVLTDQIYQIMYFLKKEILL